MTIDLTNSLQFEDRREFTPEDYARLNRACAGLVIASCHVSDTMTKVANNIGEFVQVWGEMLQEWGRKIYEDAGSPYGPSDNLDNITRWFDEMINERAGENLT